MGRGCWAGPLLVVAARSTSRLPKGLDDSKKISKNKREGLFEQIQNTCDLGEGWVLPAEIDSYGLTEATRIGVGRALNNISAKHDEEIIMDGLINYCLPAFINVKCEAKADGLYPIVSAASIYAKVTRDRYMSGLDVSYEKYKFAKHVGYGTALHNEMLKLYGVCDQHRLSFAPIKKFVTV